MKETTCRRQTDTVSRRSAGRSDFPLPLAGYRIHTSVSGGIQRARRLGCPSLCLLRLPSRKRGSSRPLRRPREGAGPSLNAEARTASRCGADACSNAPFAPPGQVERPGDGPPPSRGRRIGRRATVANMQCEAGKALAGRETASYPGSPSQAKEGGKRQTHARINHRICLAGMQNMTFRDISHGAPQGLMTFHDIS